MLDLNETLYSECDRFVNRAVPILRSIPILRSTQNLSSSHKTRDTHDVQLCMCHDVCRISIELFCLIHWKEDTIQRFAHRANSFGKTGFTMFHETHILLAKMDVQNNPRSWTKTWAYSFGNIFITNRQFTKFTCSYYHVP